jgi:hypothetical protein
MIDMRLRTLWEGSVVKVILVTSLVENVSLQNLNINWRQ